jgi:hypothetical protein
MAVELAGWLNECLLAYLLTCLLASICACLRTYVRAVGASAPKPDSSEVRPSMRCVLNLNLPACAGLEESCGY